MPKAHKIKKNPFVCIDSSERSLKAFHWFLENLYHKGDTIHLCHVHIPPDIPSLGTIHGAIELYKNDIEHSYEASKAIVAKYEDICSQQEIPYKVHMKTFNSSIGHTICNTAKHHKVSYIVISQRGLSTVRRVLMGSVSDYVLHHAHVPVLVVPPA